MPISTAGLDPRDYLDNLATFFVHDEDGAAPTAEEADLAPFYTAARNFPPRHSFTGAFRGREANALAVRFRQSLVQLGVLDEEASEVILALKAVDALRRMKEQDGTLEEGMRDALFVEDEELLGAMQNESEEMDEGVAADLFSYRWFRDGLRGYMRKHRLDIAFEADPLARRPDPPPRSGRRAIEVRKIEIVPIEIVPIMVVPIEVIHDLDEEPDADDLDDTPPPLIAAFISRR